MMLMWLIPLVLVVWLTSAALDKKVLADGCGPAKPVGYDPALEIVRERYARGDIDRATYERLVAGLFGQS